MTEWSGDDNGVPKRAAPLSVKPKPMGEAAFIGLAGTIVRTIEPHSEAAREALLMQLLASFGNAIGRHAPRYRVESDRHPGRLYVVIVGPTSRARKGTSWGRIEEVMRSAAPDWTDKHIAWGGLSTGEGLIQALDGVDAPSLDNFLAALGDEKQLKELREHQELTPMFDVLDAWNPTDGLDGLFKALNEVADDDDGDEAPDDDSDDKRLLIHEPEFARVLRVAKREGTTISAVLRTLWDRGEANVLTRHKPLRIKNAHLSLVAHITKSELRRELADVEVFDGFANRFCFIFAERSKLLPYGGEVPYETLAPLTAELGHLVKKASESTADRMGMDEKARMLWIDQYPKLTEERPGLYGAATARAEAQVVRLALLYALLDDSPLIREYHLRAALAAWHYCDSSARYLFGHRLGDRWAERILGELQHSGSLSRTELRDKLGYKVPASLINAGLEHLEEHDLVWREQVPTTGRPTEVVHLREGIDMGEER